MRPPSIVIKTRAFLLDVNDIDGAHAQHLFGEQKIGQCLLLLGMDFHQNYILGIVIADDRAA